MEIIIAVAIFVIFYTAQRRIYRRLWNRELDVDIAFADKEITAGDESTLVETVSNDKWLPLTSLHIKFSTTNTFTFANKENARVTDLYHRNDAFFVPAHRRVTRELQFVANKRGLYTINGVNVVARDFFMTKAYAASVNNDSFIYVLPKKLSQGKTKEAFSGILGEIISRKSLMEDKLSFRGIREYGTNDPMTSINWKATARGGDLLVNMYDHTSEQKVKVMLNLEPHAMMKVEAMQELLIELASTACDELLRKAIPTAFASNGVDQLTDEPHQVDFSAAPDHGRTIDKCLARINANAGLETFMEHMAQEAANANTSTAYIIISAYHKPDLIDLLDDMVAQGTNIFMITPYLDETGLNANREYIKGMELKLNEL